MVLAHGRGNHVNQIQYFKIPDAMSFDEAAISEPLAIGLYAVRQSIPMKGARVGILGFGPVDLYLTGLDLIAEFGLYIPVVPDMGINGPWIDKMQFFGLHHIQNLLLEFILALLQRRKPFSSLPSRVKP